MRPGTSDSIVHERDGTVATGAIDGSGNYSVKTATNSGLPPGDYKITVVATDPPPPGDEESPGILLTPELYNRVDSTPLQASIKAGSNIVNLTLSATPEYSHQGTHLGNL